MPRYSWLVQCTEIGQQLTPRSNGSNNTTSGDRASRTEPCLAVFDSDERVLVLRSAASQDYHREFNVSTVEVRELRQPAPGVNNPALSVVCIRWNSGWILVQSHAKQQHGELLACLREGGGRQGNRISPAVIRARVQGAVTGLKHGANNRLSIFTLTLAHDRLSVSFQRSSASKTAFSWRYVDVRPVLLPQTHPPHTDHLALHSRSPESSLHTESHAGSSFGTEVALASVPENISLKKAMLLTVESKRKRKAYFLTCWIRPR